MAACLILRRSAPGGFAVLVTVISGAHFVADAALLMPGDLVLLTAVYSVAAYASEPLRNLGLFLGGAFVALLACRALVGDSARDLRSIVLPVALVLVSIIAAWALGHLERRKAGAFRDLEQRQILAERHAEANARLAAYEERERISDDMHDVLAHTLTAIVVQAESGGTVAQNRETTELFASISTTSRAALREVRSLLSPDAGPKTRPTPGIEDLEDLIEGFALTGLKIDLTQTGKASSLTPGMGVAVYRVVQESLTNALRHGAERTVRLAMVWSMDELSVSSANPLDEPARHRPVQEHRGLASIRRRCELYGGRVLIEAGYDFTVNAAWPLRPKSSRTA
ncbi:hypothetical protein LK10_17910 [Sinomonas humi]|uniref:histidine kinase n=1 Tax=Sinomonas humi TaxID=1338436 RepID=A0A0B2AGH7_9MICC|nr:histidine kinase [Sinomonas humi]KHL01034.1 hypothetical protein LK10_17910 [Sinomonas humi]